VVAAVTTDGKADRILAKTRKSHSGSEFVPKVKIGVAAAAEGFNSANNQELQRSI